MGLQWNIVNSASNTSAGSTDSKTITDKVTTIQQLPTTQPSDVRSQTSRCGNKDLRIDLQNRQRRYQLHRNGTEKWSKTDLKYRVLNYPRQRLSPQQVHQVLRKAVNTWSRVSALTFTEVFRGPGDIRFSFGSKNHGDSIRFDGPEGVLAHAFYPNSGRHNGDVHFDDDEIWTDGTEEGKNLFGVAVHELGHTFGLEHSLNKDAIMYGVFVGFREYMNALHMDDIEGIRALYGPNKPGKRLPGDEFGYRTVRPFVPVTRPQTTPKPGVPYVCDTAVDAIMPVRNKEIAVFYENFFWRVIKSETGDGFYSFELLNAPIRFTSYWTALPENLDRIDAVYERQTDTNFMFFRGNRFWVLIDNSRLAHEFPPQGMTLQDIGLPVYVKKVDALFAWGYKSDYGEQSEFLRTFLFAGELYWEFKETNGYYGSVSAFSYPRRIADVWRGVPDYVDAIHTHTDGQSYFFKGKKYYSFNNRRMKVRNGYPKKSSLTWLGCTANVIHSRRSLMKHLKNT